VFIGLRLRGIVGAATALTGLLIAPFFAVIAFVVLYDQISSLIWLPPAMDGVSAAATGLLIIVGVKGGLRTIGKFAPMAALVATGFMVGILQWPLLPVVFCVAPLSIAAAWPRKRRDA
jgi:chromate transporter